MRTSVLLAAALASTTACSGSPKPEPRPPATDPNPVDDLADPVEPTDSDPEALARRERVEKSLARIPAIKQGLTALRELAFKADVPAEYQTPEAFRAFVTAEIKAELAPDKATAIATAMHHVGLLAQEIDLVQALGDALVSQAAAYYDPKQDKFFVVMVPKDDLALDSIGSHELTHALQDQHFGLEAYLLPEVPLDDDQAIARKFVVEGEATLTMFAYAGEQIAGDQLGGKHLLDPGIRNLLKLGLVQAAAMTIDDFRAQTKAQATGAVGIDDDIQKALDSMDAIPPAILVPMLDSYMKGALAVFTVFDAGGWSEVAALYAHPPDSTEQMLHPDTRLYPKRDVPKQVTLTLPAGFTEVYGNVIGELEWRVYFSLWMQPVAGKPQTTAIEAAADGWDGDRWSVVKAADGTLVGLVVTTWDSAAEAKQFATAYTATIRARFPNQEREVWIKTVGATVYIVDGGRDAKLIDALIKGTKVT